MEFPIPESLLKKFEKLLSAPVDEMELDLDLDEIEEDMDEGISQEELEDLPVYTALKSSVREGMTLEELIDAFAAMNRIPVGDEDMLLFEAGTFDFTGEELFHFSLTRQFQIGDMEEFIQLHLDIRYALFPGAAELEICEWASPEEDFFNMVRNSEAFQAVKERPIVEVEVYIEET